MMLRNRFRRVLALVVALSFVPAAAVLGQTAGVAPAGESPFARTALDTTCAPCTDFNQFANGVWKLRNPIPASYAAWGSFYTVNDANEAALAAILNGLARNPSTAATPDERKLGMYYASCIDSAAVERAGTVPIQPLLRIVDAAQSSAGVATSIVELQRRGVSVLFAAGSLPDARNSDLVLAYVGENGIGLPERDYYFGKDQHSAEIRDAYKAHGSRVLQLLGASPTEADSSMAAVFALETTLAATTLNAVEVRDPEKTYHPMDLRALRALAPSIDWTAFMGLSETALAHLNVDHPEFFRVADSLLRVTPTSTWRAYARLRVISQYGAALPAAFVNENFRYQQKLTGAKSLLPREKRCLRVASATMSHALGQAFVKSRFSPEAKKRALTILANVRSVMRDRLAHEPWMSDSTRAQALIKIDAFVDKIGYPDHWRTYDALSIEPSSSYADNAIAARRFQLADAMSRVGKPRDRARWTLTAYDVNAGYNPSANDVTFPAGILQAPFFDPNADDAVNYGAFGAVVGHEITHGFDKDGAQYDAHGNLRNWWNTGDLREFRSRTQSLVDQFSSYTTLDSLHLRGDLEIGENTADLGGLSIAYEALQRSMAGKPRPPAIDGFTPEQRFFLGWARVWAENIRPEAERQQVLTNEHPPGKFRVNGPLSNLPEFAKAWGCQATGPMVRAPSERVVIW